jgi:arylsulfatase A-like enzyme
MKVARYTAIILGLVIAFSCQKNSGHPPMIILISLDTVRADHLSGYGYHRATTPGIDQVAKESVTFSQAFTPMPNTLPAHLSLFSSRYPRDHKVLSNSWRLVEKLPFLSTALAQAGYKTGGFIGSAILDRDTGMAAGFDFYDDDFEHYSQKVQGRNNTLYRKTAAEVVDRAIQWVTKQKRSKPLFLFLHFYDAHPNYNVLPSAYKQMFPTDVALAQIMQERNQKKQLAEHIDFYDGGLRYIDDSLQKLWTFLKAEQRYEQALIVIAADHGEGLGEHNYLSHGLKLYEEQMHIPLIIRFPGGANAGRIEELVTLLDVAPTILDFSGLPALPGQRGQSLLNLIQKNEKLNRPYVYYERKWCAAEAKMNEKNWEPGERFGVRSERFSYIWHSQFPAELYDIRNDPHELHDIVTAQPGEVAQLHQALTQYWEMIRKATLIPPKLKESTRQKLKSLGYMQ